MVKMEIEYVGDLAAWKAPERLGWLLIADFPRIVKH